MEPKGLAAAVLASLPLEAGIVAGQMIQDVTYIVIFLEYPHLLGDDLPAGENRIFQGVPEIILVVWERGRFLIILSLFCSSIPVKENYCRSSYLVTYYASLLATTMGYGTFE